MNVDSGTPAKKSNARLGSCTLVMGDGLLAWTKSGNLIASRMKKTGRLLPTRSQFPWSVWNLTAKPRGSRAASGEPRKFITVENRTKTGVSLPGAAKSEAFVYFEKSVLATKTP